MEVSASDFSPVGQRLLQALEGLGCEFGLERSFKISADGVNHDRFAALLHKSAFGPDAALRLAGLMHALAMPADLRDRFLALLDQAEFVHFGFEGPDRVKIYLELGRVHPKDGTEARPLIHLAAKWRPNSDEAPAVSRYFNPAMARTVSGAEQRLGTLFANCAGMPSVALARAILMKLVRTGAQDCFFFMEVEDEGTPRLSFDLNIYPAELAVADFEGAIQALLADYHVPVPVSEALLAASRLHAFGHVSGGLDRRGVDFTTIYYGMRPHRGCA